MLCIMQFSHQHPIARAISQPNAAPIGHSPEKLRRIGLCNVVDQNRNRAAAGFNVDCLRSRLCARHRFRTAGGLVNKG
jgi:hypothetical protein